MLHVSAAGTSRQAVILTAIVSMHVGLLWVVAHSKVDIWRAPSEPKRGPITWVKPPPPPPPVQPKFQGPMAIPIGDYFPPPPVEFPDFPTSRDLSTDTVTLGTTSGGQTGSAPDIRSQPRIAMDLRRLSALINACYPSAARRMSEEGTVRVRVMIGANGRVVSWRVLRSSGFPRLDAAVPCVIERLPFTAATQNGSAISSEVDLPIVFRLN